MIRGITVTLIAKTAGTPDSFNRPTYTETEIAVNNVLVAPSGYSSEQNTRTDISTDIDTYELAIPKGDTNTWEGNDVKIFGERFRVIGEPIQGIEENIPGPWHKKVKVMRVE